MSDKGCGGTGTCAIGMADLECSNCPVDWGVRYLDGVVMKRHDRGAAQRAVDLFPGRALMWRVSDGWREYTDRPADRTSGPARPAVPCNPGDTP